jgi:hypothetical protein
LWEDWGGEFDKESLELEEMGQSGPLSRWMLGYLSHLPAKASLQDLTFPKKTDRGWTLDLSLSVFGSGELPMVV